MVTESIGWRRMRSKLNGASEGTKRYFHFDGSGNAYALTDENENLKDSYVYTQTGVTVSATSTNGPSVNPMRFGGMLGVYDDGAMGSAAQLICVNSLLVDPNTSKVLNSAFGGMPFGHSDLFQATKTVGCENDCPSGWKYLRTCSMGSTATVSLSGCKKKKGGRICTDVCASLKNTIKTSTPGDCRDCANRGHKVVGCIKHKEVAPPKEIDIELNPPYVGLCVCTCTMKLTIETELCCCCSKATGHGTD